MAKQKSQKDTHDYIYLYGMLILTAVIAFSAFHVVPNTIENAALSEWQRVDYKELMGWMDATFTNTNEIIIECDSLSPGNTKVLNNTYATCVDGKIVHAIIKKDEEGECFQKWEGTCG